ncbi:hypothetical protein L218DRAFT_1004515 [Marasmius fiardii PR-910]|nr:hypothetical protein L218DRAFT_1004515 [Marasmius fiardii PR-910]
MSTRKRPTPSRKRMSAILACSALSPTLDMLDFGMLHSTLSESPKDSSSSRSSHDDEEFSSYELIPLRRLNRREGKKREPIPIPLLSDSESTSPDTKRTPPSASLSRSDSNRESLDFFDSERSSPMSAEAVSISVSPS